MYQATNANNLGKQKYIFWPENTSLSLQFSYFVFKNTSYIYI